MSTRWLLLVGLLILVLSACNGGAQEIVLVTPTAMLITAEPPTPTDLPPPTVTMFPSGTPEPTETPEGYRPTPTQIVQEEILMVVVDEEVTDGLYVRTGPGYVCDSIGDTHCNIVDAIFPDDTEYMLLTVDTTFDVAWCEYNDDVAINAKWSACEFLKPASVDDCATAFDVSVAQYLAECRTGDAG